MQVLFNNLQSHFKQQNTISSRDDELALTTLKNRKL